MLLFGVVAGVAADRWGRKRQLIIAQNVNAILNLILATLIVTHNIQVWHVYVTGFLAGTVQAFQQPARQALINDLVGGKSLLNAISLNSAALNVSRSIGPAICGALIAAFGVGPNYYIQAAFYMFATVWTIQIKVPETPVPVKRSQGAEPQSLAAPQSFFESMKEGFAYIATHRMILALMVLGMVPILLGNPYTSLMPIFAIDVLHGNASTQGLLLTMAGIGALLGALTIASLGRRQGSGKLMILGAAGFGLSLVLFSRSPVLWMAMLSTFLAGLSNSQYTSQNQTIIQTITPAAVRGRVLGVYLLNRGLMPVGSLLAGVLAHLLGGPMAVTIMGTSCLLLVIVVAVLKPDIWKSKFISSNEQAVS